MKKRYYILIYIALTIIGLLIYYFNPYFEPIVVNLVIINIIIFIIRKPLFSLMAYIFKKRIYRAVISILVNLIWSIFLLSLIFFVWQILFWAIIPFLIVSISLNLNKIVNNIAAGIIMLSSEQFQIGDLIETNGIQGIVEEINLNYLKVKEFDGLTAVIPNSNVYGSSIVKFTYNKFRTYPKLTKQEFGEKKDYHAYISRLNKLLNAQIKTTTYIKNIYLKGNINPLEIDNLLTSVFDKYKALFGIKPDYAVDTTEFGRVGVNLYIKSNDPKLIINYTDCFLRDIIYQLYPDLIYNGWEKYKKSILKGESKEGGDSQ
jgi:small-conductance mechanosensitive channel